MSNQKLRFYNTIKDKFRQKNYHKLTQKRNQGGTTDLAKHRLSEHKMNIQVGRHQKKLREKMRVRKSCMMIAVMKK